MQYNQRQISFNVSMSSENFNEINSATIENFHSQSASSSSSSKKRERVSLDPSDTTNKKHCEIIKSSEMSKPLTENQAKTLIENALKDFEQRQSQTLISSLKNELMTAFDTSLQNMQANMSQQLNAISDRLTALEGRNATQLDEVRAQINVTQEQADYNTRKIQQRMLDCELVARGIPTIYANAKEDLIKILNEKLNTNLNASTLSTITSLNARPNQYTGTYFFKFKAKNFKDDFLKQVDAFRERDIIAVEDIFENFKNTNHAGHRISFRNSLTKQTKAVLDAAHRAKSQNLIAHAWERDGSIFMRKNATDRAVEVLSINHIDRYAAGQN